MRTKVCILITLLSLNFAYAQNNHQDLSNAYPLCALGALNFNSTKGAGQEKEFFTDAQCIDGTAFETNATWFTWHSSDRGTLSFVIEPYNLEDDFDFILYKRSVDSKQAEVVRCMASGRILGNERLDISNCLGKTGLKANSFDEIELQGCQFTDDNYLKFLSMEANEEYFLVVNNFASGQGFSILFEGDAKLKPLNDCELPLDLSSLSFGKVFPNPAFDILNTIINSDKDQTVELSFVDLNGKIYRNEQVNLTKGENSLQHNVQDLPSGIYLIKANNENTRILERFNKSK